MSKDLQKMSQQELIALIEREREVHENLKEAYIERILNNDDRASHFNFRQSIREDINNNEFDINRSFAKDDKNIEKNFLNDFKEFALKRNKLGFDNYEDVQITDWIKNGVYYDINKNTIIAHSIGYNYNPLMIKHLLTELPEDAISDLSFERNDLIDISKKILDTKNVSIEYQKNALSFMHEIIVQYKDPALLREFHDAGKEVLKNHINLYEEVLNKDINIFNVSYNDVPFDKIVSKIEENISRYNNVSDFVEKGISHFVDAGLFDKEIKKMSDNNFDIYSDVLKVKNEKEYKNVNNVLELFTKDDLKKDFARLLLIRETEIILDHSPETTNKNKLKF